MTSTKRATRFRWTPEEREALFGEFNRHSRPQGIERTDFVMKMAELFPHRTLGAIHHLLTQFMQGGKIERQRTQRDYTPLVLTEPEAAWLAGILDGEGSLRDPKTYYRKGKGYSNGHVLQAVAVYNTDMAIIEKTAALLPMGRVTKNIQTRSTVRSTKPIYNVRICGARTIKDYLQRLLPYRAHTEKRLRAAKIIELVDGMKMSRAR